MATIKRIITFICTAAIIVAAVFAVTSRFTIPGGYRVYSVLTGSMKPFLRPGTLIVTQVPVNSHAISKGSIITFREPQKQNQFVTHRVDQVVEQGVTRFFLTKGDANQAPDPWQISYGQIVGLYRTQVPYLGSFFQLLRTPPGIVIFILVPVLIVALMEIQTIFSIIVESKVEDLTKLKDKSSKILGLILILSLYVLASSRTYSLFTSNLISINGAILATGELGPPNNQTAQLSPTADTELSRRLVNFNFGQSIQINVSSSQSIPERLLLRYDLTQLPPGAIITNCTLHLYHNSVDSADLSEGVYRLNTTDSTIWQEGTGLNSRAKTGETTWWWLSGPTPWQRSGGDFNLTPTATQTINPEPSWTTWNVSPDCQADSVISWIVKDDSEATRFSHVVNYYSRESRDQSLRPYLEVSYELPTTQNQP